MYDLDQTSKNQTSTLIFSQEKRNLPYQIHRLNKHHDQPKRKEDFFQINKLVQLTSTSAPASSVHSLVTAFR
jgi:hypothetical protein